MIKPHGSDSLNPLFVYDSEQHRALAHESVNLPSLLVNSAAASNAVMMGGGYFNPLTGFMNQADYTSVVDTMHLSNGLVWSIPITLPASPTFALNRFAGG